LDREEGAVERADRAADDEVRADPRFQERTECAYLNGAETATAGQDERIAHLTGCATAAVAVVAAIGQAVGSVPPPPREKR
jgi:hypothetical protein